jgi:hypothetical protein
VPPDGLIESAEHGTVQAQPCRAGPKSTAHERVCASPSTGNTRNIYKLEIYIEKYIEIYICTCTHWSSSRRALVPHGSTHAHTSQIRSGAHWFLTDPHTHTPHRSTGVGRREHRSTGAGRREHRSTRARRRGHRTTGARKREHRSTGAWSTEVRRALHRDSERTQRALEQGAPEFVVRRAGRREQGAPEFAVHHAWRGRSQ